MRVFNKICGSINYYLAWAAGAALLGAMFITVGQMFMRAFFVPFEGTYEIVGWLTAIATALALGYTQGQKGHISIDILVNKLSFRRRAAVGLAVLTISAALFAVLTGEMFLFGAHLKTVGSLSETLRAAYYPFTFITAIGTAGLFLALTADLLKHYYILLGKAENYW